jgi:hypothetical protein
VARRGGLFLVDADKPAPLARDRKLSATLKAYIDPREEYKQIFAEKIWRNRAQQSVRQNMHRSDYCGHEEDVRAVTAVRDASCRLELPDGHDGREVAIEPRYVSVAVTCTKEVPTSDRRIARCRLHCRSGALSHHQDLPTPKRGTIFAHHSQCQIAAVSARRLSPGDQRCRGCAHRRTCYRLLGGTANRQPC